MTREEAIRELKADYCGNRIVCELHPDQCNREDCEIWLAIKALQAQDVDAVSRKAVMWMLTNLSYTQCRTQGEAEVIGLAKTLLIAMPSAQEANNSNQEVNNSTETQPNGIESQASYRQVTGKLDVTDCISRQAASDVLEKCYTCKHVYQRVSDADTIYCRCRKGCRYEEVKPRRSGESPRRHEG